MAYTPPVASAGFSDARKARIMAWQGSRYIDVPADKIYGLLDIRNISSLSIGTSFNLAPLHVGNLNVENSANSQILISRTVQSASSTSEHAYSDSSNVIGGNAGLGYNSFDARITYSGSNNSDHYAGFQASPVYGSSGTMGDMYLHTAQPTVSAGTITRMHGYYMHNPTGAGTVGTLYGVYVASLTKGGTNYAFYSAGSTPSVFGGPISVGGGNSIAQLATGTFTPTQTGVANVASSTAFVCHYIRVGDHVMVYGVTTITPSSATTTSLGISLPIASNFAATTDLRGTANTISVSPGTAGVILADATNDRATLSFIAPSTAAFAFSFTFGYQII